MTIVLPLAVCLVGLVVYFAANPSTSPRICEVGRICFGFGLLVFLLKAAPALLNLPR